MSEQENRAIVPVSHELAALGRRPEVKELARRIQTQGPAGMKLTGPEALTLAQYSFSLGANPLIGETWLLKSQDRVLGVMPGVRLYRRRADENDERTDNVRWMEPEVVADSDARSQLGVPLDARICVSVRLYRRSQTQAYAALAESLSKAGAPWSDIRQIAGTKPYITGVGYVTSSEKSKMPDYQCALKRAEVHALKQAYHLPFGFIALGEGAESEVPDGAVLEEYIHEGEWKEVADDNRTPEEKHENAVKGAEALYGDPVEAFQKETGAVKTEPQPLDKADRPLTPSLLAAFLARRADGKHANGIASKEQRGLAMGALEMCFAGDKASTEKRHSVLAYAFKVTSGNNLTNPQVLALLDWLAPSKDSGGHWTPERMAVTEANAIVAARMVEAGQEPLPMPEPVPF